jgi:hypothetical protein
MDSVGAPKGNSCVYCLFMVSNFLLLFIGCGTITAGIYVAASIDRADWYNISFIGLGFLTVLVFVLGCRTKRSLSGTCFYLVFTLMIFVTQLCFTFAIIFYPDFETLLGLTSANAVRYSLLVACVIILLCFLTGWWYRNSLMVSRLHFEHDYTELGRKLNA